MRGLENLESAIRQGTAWIEEFGKILTGGGVLVPCPVGAGTGSLDPIGIQPLLAEGGDDSGKRTVRAGRRRRAKPSDSGSRERADTPSRRETSSPSSSPSSSAPRPRDTGGTSSRPRPSSRPPSSGGGMPANVRLPGGPLGIILVVGVIICALIFMLIIKPGGSNQGGSDVAYTQPTPAPAPTEVFVPPTATAPAEIFTPVPFVAPSTSTEDQTWLVMLYLDADDKILEQDIYVDLNEAERVGSTDRVHIVAQVDRYRGGYQGDGNWTSTKRFYVTQDGDLQRVQSQQVSDLGEANMSDGESLVDFVSWAVETFPADKYVLIMSDHGMGWPGGWSDPAPGGTTDRSSPLTAQLGDKLFLMELDQALEKIRAQTSLNQFELIGMDACLMGGVEIFTALAPHARYAVASQETEPALGWAYTGFLEELAANPDMDGAQLGQLIVDNYIQNDQRILDDQARAELLKQGSPMGGLFSLFGGVSADQVSQQMEQGITLTTIDLAAMPQLVDSINQLAYTLQGTKQQPVAQARSYAQSFTSVFGKDVPPSYIDLGNFVQLLKKESGNPAVAQAADGVLAALDQAVVSERHGSKKPGATGVSVYFPNSKLYKSPLTGPESYTSVARRFANVSLWDDFLAYHYTGRPFQATAAELVIPEAGSKISAPGAGKIQVSPITMSDQVAAPGRPVLLSMDIQGDTVGYIYLFAGFYDQASNAIFVADTDYLESDTTRQIDGIYYPDWGEGEFTLEYEWEPIVFAIDDGSKRVVAHFTPETYGASFEDATYTVDGTYTYADGGESRHARLYFRNAILRQVFGFTGEGGLGAPREIIPQAGDTFTVQENWIDLDQNGQVAGSAVQEGGTLTFGDQMFTWEELDAAAGNYVVGFIVEDMDGNQYPVYNQVTVQ